jgi:hypothetical protein
VSPANSNGRPGLKRSFTHTGAGDRRHSYHQSQVSFASNVSVHSNRPGVLSRNGRSSPLKSSHDYNIHAAAQRKRSSLTFIIDEDGRAKTIVTKLPDDDLMDLDEESTESDSDSTDQPIHSFAFEEQDETVPTPPVNPPTQARIAPERPTGMQRKPSAPSCTIALRLQIQRDGRLLCRNRSSFTPLHRFSSRATTPLLPRSRTPISVPRARIVGARAQRGVFVTLIVPVGNL